MERFCTDCAMLLGAEVNVLTTRGKAALHWAAQKGDRFRGRNLGTDLAQAITVLPYAATQPLRNLQYQSRAELRALVPRGLISQRHVTNRAHVRPEEQEGHAEIAALLIDAGAEVNATDVSSESLLSCRWSVTVSRPGHGVVRLS
eukprot:1541509-Rhodomonas_salina.1